MNDYKEELGTELEKDEMEEIKNETLTKEQLDELDKLHFVERNELNNNTLIINRIKITLTLIGKVLANKNKIITPTEISECLTS